MLDVLLPFLRSIDYETQRSLRLCRMHDHLLNNARFGVTIPHESENTLEARMESGPPGGVTQLLIDVSKGDERAIDELLPLVYDEMRRLAAAYMSRERGDHTLQPTALVHETYLKLIDQRKVDWQNRAHFFGLAAEIMRRILVNHARDKRAGKRGGGAQKVSLSVAADAPEKSDLDVLALDEALERLAAIDKRKARVIELKFFGGMTSKEISEILQISDATVEREWSFARAWLFEAIENN
jgi:RNA polymerase sigma factor (TIGR02999 family)